MQDCVEWSQSTTNGYGQTFRNGRNCYAHRVAYEDVHGPIPEGMTVHHLCENRRCINVDHMELLRRDEHAGGKGHGKLLREDARKVREMLSAGRLQREVASHFGVSRTLVSLIGSGKRWA